MPNDSTVGSLATLFFYAFVALLIAIVINHFISLLFKHLARKKALGESIVRVVDDFLNNRLPKLVHQIMRDDPAAWLPGLPSAERQAPSPVSYAYISPEAGMLHNVPPKPESEPCAGANHILYVVGLIGREGLFLATSTSSHVFAIWRQTEVVAAGLLGRTDCNGNVAPRDNLFITGRFHLGDRLELTPRWGNNVSYTAMPYDAMVKAFFSQEGQANVSRAE